MTLSKAGSWIAAGIVGLSLIGTAAYVVFGTNYATKNILKEGLRQFEANETQQ